MTTLGLDLGGTKILAALVDGDGRTLAQKRVATAVGGVEVVLGQLEELARTLRVEAPFDAIGVGFPGLVDSARGVARSSVILRGWRDVEVAAHLTRRLDLPCVLDNDVHQAARAEIAARGGARERAELDFLLATIGTGIGGALVLRGELWPGAGGLAGEVGHVSIDRDGPECACGRRGCLGALASGGAIESRLALERGGLQAALRAGDERARRALDEAAERLGFGLASVMNVLALPLFVLGGGVVEIDPGFVDRVHRAAARAAMPEIAAATQFERARAGYVAGAIGAALHARLAR